MTQAEKLHAYNSVRHEIEEAISNTFEKYEPDIYDQLDFEIGSDDYDNSIEIYIANSLPYPYEPCYQVRKEVFDLGFSNVYWNFKGDRREVMCNRVIGKWPHLVKDDYDEVRNWEPRHSKHGYWEGTKYGYVDERFNEKEWLEKYNYRSK